MENIDVYDMTHANNPMILKSHGEITQTLMARMGTGGNQVPVLHDKEVRRVRKLTPMECERLQGLSDDWTNVEFNGKPASDSLRLKAVGNGMAQPCADFVMKQIAKYAGKERKQAPEKLADEIIDAMEKAKTVK
ncbi:DNA cytosine methyltransferase [uncultured Mitsuokella sp.]|uniref:DNA cytosine methyltransferase n=1 Tax=uncultured Mitsuokella sp. TaxID=453120 RepID=UPI0026DD52B2|nr:DNA cytosine methyltransferase [uncultured Mitsuokella sp.]